MQIMYELTLTNVSKWKHKSLVMSVSFVATEYAPGEGFTFGKQINRQLENGSVVDFGKLLPIVSGLNVIHEIIQMLLYKGVHSSFPEDKTTLWLVRKELLLMSQQQFSDIKALFLQQSEKQMEEYHGLLQRVSDVNEIREWQKVVVG